jgi:hypothetical protein
LRKSLRYYFPKTTTTPIRLTRSRVFADISDGMPDRAEVEIMGTAVLHPAEITGMAVLLVEETTGMVALLMAEMMGMVDLPLAEMTVMAEEAVTRRETRGTLVHPNERAPRPGHVGLPPPR